MCEAALVVAFGAVKLGKRHASANDCNRVFTGETRSLMIKSGRFRPVAFSPVNNSKRVNRPRSKLRRGFTACDRF
ncbi:MAG TPA: hypothetical protein VNI02_13935 [Blastocatellia bacterium]|nr:hypothetical protein [Blastocatellia bacterium]